MRMPHVRFTVRQLMVVVAILSISLAGTLAYRRYLFCRRNAEHQSELKVLSLGIACRCQESAAFFKESAQRSRRENSFDRSSFSLADLQLRHSEEFRKLAERASWEAQVHADNQARLEQAMCRPWGSIPAIYYYLEAE